MSFYVNSKYRIRRAAEQQEMMQKLLAGKTGTLYRIMQWVVTGV